MSDDRPVQGTCTDLFGFYFKVDDPRAWQARHNGEVDREKPTNTAEVVIDIGGHRALMTLDAFVTTVFGADVANEVFDLPKEIA